MANGGLFKPATQEQIRLRKEMWLKDWDQKLKTFKSRQDVFPRADGGFDVRGDVQDWGSKDYKCLALKYRIVTGNFSCGGTFQSLKGAPKLICGNFSFHGELRSLKVFPKEVWGNVDFINHPYPGNRRNAKRWTVSDIKKVCDIRGTIKVENHEGL